MNVEIGTEARYSISGNICFKFSAFCLCSAGKPSPFYVSFFLVSTLYCTENLKHIFPEMKLCGLVPNFYIHVSGIDFHIPRIGLIWNLYFPELHERTLSSTAEVERRLGNCRQALVDGSSLLSPPLLQLSREFA
jgi:hypothetical protein